MSATTQSLMEQVEELRTTIALKEMKGEDVSSLKEKLTFLHEKLMNASQALNEGKQILKG